jgi:hypothetical protein
MGAREFEMVKGATLRIDPLAGDSLRVRSGAVWVTQLGDTRDYMLRAGDSLTLSGKGVALATASKPTLLDLFRDVPAAVHEPLEKRARSVRALLRKIFA